MTEERHLGGALRLCSGHHPAIIRISHVVIDACVFGADDGEGRRFALVCAPSALHLLHFQRFLRHQAVEVGVYRFEHSIVFHVREPLAQKGAALRHLKIFKKRLHLVDFVEDHYVYESLIWP